MLPDPSYRVNNVRLRAICDIYGTAKMEVAGVLAQIGELELGESSVYKKEDSSYAFLDAA